TRTSTKASAIVPGARVRYLAEISDTVRGYKKRADDQAQIAREKQHLTTAQKLLSPLPAKRGEGKGEGLSKLIKDPDAKLEPHAKALLGGWPKLKAAYTGDKHTYRVRDKDVTVDLTRTSLSGTKIPKVALPSYTDEGDLLKWLYLENLPGHFP